MYAINVHNPKYTSANVRLLQTKCSTQLNQFDIKIEIKRLSCKTVSAGKVFNFSKCCNNITKKSILIFFQRCEMRQKNTSWTIAGDLWRKSVRVCFVLPVCLIWYSFPYVNSQVYILNIITLSLMGHLKLYYCNETITHTHRWTSYFYSCRLFILFLIKTKSDSSLYLLCIIYCCDYKWEIIASLSLSFTHTGKSSEAFLIIW